MQKETWWRRWGRLVTLRRIILVWVALAVFSGGVLVGQNWHRTPVNYPERTGLPKQFDYTQVDEVYQAIREKYDGKLTERQVLDGLKHGLAESTKDPYTEFFTATEAEEFNDDLQGTISGVGAKLELDQDSNVVIVAPLSGSPAETAGLRAKDIIVGIDGKTTSGMTATEAVLKIRGKKGTTVKLTIVRDKKDQLEFTITRDTIHVPTVESKVLDGNIGYLQVSQFSDDTDELAAKAARDFVDKGVNAVVLDLRDNPGGEVSSSVGLSGLWLDNGDVVVQQKRGGVVSEINRVTGSVSPLKGMKTVVLINGGSASASEITALALRDKAGARIIGEKSYGKGVVQQLLPFDDGSSLKVTVGKWYSPKGTNIDKKGITPDQMVKPSDEDIKNKNDIQLQAAQSWLGQ
ncbi:MAG: S41 family peptidase [Candidatus Saccharimonadales bacterium]|nr:S41 family peptidase [Candidatus Saccharibacteria bacterium]